MKDILFFIGLFLTIVLSGSYLIILWKKEKTNLFQQQMQESFKMADELAEVIKKPSLEILADFKKENDKRFMQEQLKVRLNKEDKIKNIDNEALYDLMKTGMTKQEAKKFLKVV